MYEKSQLAGNFQERANPTRDDAPYRLPQQEVFTTSSVTLMVRCEDGRQTWDRQKVKTHFIPVKKKKNSLATVWCQTPREVGNGPISPRC